MVSSRWRGMTLTTVAESCPQGIAVRLRHHELSQFDVRGYRGLSRWAVEMCNGSALATPEDRPKTGAFRAG
jgi:hypothetical protein